MSKLRSRLRDVVFYGSVAASFALLGAWLVWGGWQLVAAEWVAIAVEYSIIVWASRDTIRIWRRRLVCVFRGHDRRVDSQSFGGRTLLTQIKVDCTRCDDSFLFQFSMHGGDGVYYAPGEVKRLDFGP